MPPEIGAFLGSLTVRRIPNTRLLEVSFESTDPVWAAKALNAHLDKFKEQNAKSRNDAIKSASTWLQDELNELSIKVRDSENARIAYERNNQIWNVDDKNDKRMSPPSGSRI